MIALANVYLRIMRQKAMDLCFEQMHKTFRKKIKTGYLLCTAMFCNYKNNRQTWNNRKSYLPQ